MKRNKMKGLIIEQLKQMPIIQIASKKSGIGRATYYRWRKEDKKFTKDSDEAITEGLLLINDLAESQLLAAIQDRNMTALIFWLRNRHPAYSNKLEITGHLKHSKEELTLEEKKLIRKALKLALPPINKYAKKK